MIQSLPRGFRGGERGLQELGPLQCFEAQWPERRVDGEEAIRPIVMEFTPDSVTARPIK